MRTLILVSSITTFLLLTIFAVATATADSNAPYYGPRKIVRVQNDMDRIVKVHCWSKDDDLGVKKLVKGQYMEWHFRNSLFMDTLFWCTIQWPHGQQRTITAYKQLRDNPRCSLKCWWSLQKTGGYYFNEMGSQKYELMYPWKIGSKN